jgi:hypothetical protein
MSVKTRVAKVAQEEGSQYPVKEFIDSLGSDKEKIVFYLSVNIEEYDFLEALEIALHRYLEDAFEITAKTEGGAEYLYQTAKQVMKGDYRSIKEIRDELYDLEVEFKASVKEED